RASRGLKQGHFDGTRFYGEQILDYLRMSQTVSTPSVTSPLPPPLAGTAALAPATPVAETGRTFEVDVQTAPLRLRREPRIDRDRPSRNVIAHLPDGHLVRLVSERTHGQFLEVETHLDGAHLRGFAA